MGDLLEPLLPFFSHSFRPEVAEKRYAPRPSLSGRGCHAWNGARGKGSTMVREDLNLVDRVYVDPGNVQNLGRSSAPCRRYPWSLPKVPLPRYTRLQTVL